MAAQIELVRNDTLPNFGGTVDFDLTGYTVTLHIDFPSILVKTAVISDTSPTSSKYDFTFETGDLTSPKGTYDFELQFYDGGNGIITYKEDEKGAKLKLKLKDEIA